MPNPKYDIVFEGRYVEGADPARVRALISEIFKVGREDSRRLFSGRRFVIKKGVELPEAHRFKNLLRKAGAACRVVPQDVILTDPPDPPPAATGQTGDRETKSNSDGSETGSGRQVSPPPGDALRPRAKGGATGKAERAKVLKRGPGRMRVFQVLLVALAILVAVGFAVPWHGGGPMPTDATTLERFTSAYKTGLLDVDIGRSRAITQIGVAKEVVEDMGYDYDQTLLAWRFNPALSRDLRRRAIGDDYLIGPIRIQFELDPGVLRSVLDPATYAAMEEIEGVGDHITLRSIEMLRECARGEDRVPHEALTAGLGKFNVPVDPRFPELSIEEAFYGLRYNGLIRIHKQRAWNTKWVELEILDRAQIADQERRLRWLESMQARYATN
ncbi:MAG: hypothetical protein QNI85_08235 [Desulfobacterales bacterium]|nr:hypothetical protein [Desulfobacterales bacterium]MDJ0989985.1 hypothetical protein [Desulfobacterales bacterium]